MPDGEPPPLPVRESGTTAPRPKDAATVIVWRRRRGRIEVLMGERHRAHSFMPQRYVFPGGRVDAGDARVRHASDMTSAVAAQLARTTRPGRGRSIVTAAVRETFEETGLLIGASDPMPEKPVPQGWERFFETGLAPALDRLVYVARAITPPFRPQRFDARFFMIGAEETQGRLQGSGELEKLDWVPLGGADGMELAVVTRRVLEYVDELFSGGRAPDDRIPLFRHMPNGRHLRIPQ